MKADLHPQEQLRLAALERYQILDTPREPQFDAIAELIASICGTPIAVVNLIAEGRQFFKSEVGIGVRDMPLEPSICAHAILLEDIMVVQDTLDDQRFTDNPLVLSEPGLRFYAGALLKSDDDLPIGTLCVLDHEPRQLTADQESALRTLAQHVMHLLEMRVAQQREARLMKKLEASLASQKRLTSAVCHDLRTPVQTVSLSASMLERQEDPELREVAQRLHRMSEQMVGLIDDLQDHDALKAGRLSLEIAETDPAAMLDSLGDSFSLAAEQANLRLRVERPTQLPMVMADQRRLAQMLSNLVQNAIKFTPEGGEVVVSAKPADQRVRFAVDDTGIGIDDAEVAKLCEPHWRSDKVRNLPGTGLGLSIVQMLAQQHGSDIEITSQPGVGSSFSFELPT